MTIIARTGGKALLLACTATFASIAAMQVPAHAQGADTAKAEFAIPGQDLDDALRQFALVSGIDVVFDPVLVENKRTAGVQGQRSADEALRVMLAGSGLMAERMQTGGFVIRHVGGRSSVGESEAGQGPAEIASVEGESPVIVVTGTHIRGAAAAGAELKVITRGELDRSGYATVQDYMRILPQNFSGGGASEDYSQGTLVTSNIFGGSGIDLRGLGADSTLVLINSRRIPAAGLQGNFTDISIIPQSAIERIEVLPDGASALYGSDAVGGVVNFILRKDFDGAETRMHYGTATEGRMEEFRIAQAFGKTWSSGHALISYEYHHRDLLSYGERDFAATADLRPRGGRDYRLFNSNPGNILDPATFQPAFGIPANQNGRSLAVEDLLANDINLQDRDLRASLLPEQERHSLFLSTEQSLSNSINIFGELLLSERNTTSLAEADQTEVLVQSTNPFYVNPFRTDSVWVSYSFIDDFGPRETKGRVRNGTATAGIRADIGRWRLETTLSHGQQKSRNSFLTLNTDELNRALSDPNPDTALNVFGHGSNNNSSTLEKIRHTSGRRAHSYLTNAAVVLDGPIVSFANRPVSVAIGAD